ncbi:MAG TPA: hypothetical protein VFR59_03350 [Steroidobacteraceae bacterium]|nr:hypothetical protein [Steroidobacteraceae bacterium]
MLTWGVYAVLLQAGDALDGGGDWLAAAPFAQSWFEAHPQAQSAFEWLVRLVEQLGAVLLALIWSAGIVLLAVGAWTASLVLTKAQGMLDAR